MTILEIYKERNTDKKWFNSYSKLERKAYGRMFFYTNTNFRTQKTFIDDFRKFLEIENKPRNDWPNQKNHKQEIHKQYVMNMLQSKLFKKDAQELYSRTSKGMLYGDFINLKITEIDQWLINYFFLLNGYYANQKNYIIYRVKDDLLEKFLSVDNLTVDKLLESAIKLISLNDVNFSHMTKMDFFYFHSFYNDPDFLTAYLRSNDSEKKDLANYISNNYKNKSYNCCLSKKYKPSGNFNKSMLVDEAKVFFITLIFLKSENINLNNFVRFFIDVFDKNIASLNREFIKSYIYKNSNVFFPIFEEVLEIEEIEFETFDEKERRVFGRIERDKPEEFIDETSEGGKQKIKLLYAIRKKQARLESNYTCALEKINNCQSLYFTAKTNQKNYIEVHHLIPREFRNDFSYSLEVLANYITLCPRCHRQIHLATDRERKHLINALYEERKKRLKIVGLLLDIKNMYNYYHINY